MDDMSDVNIGNESELDRFIDEVMPNADEYEKRISKANLLVLHRNGKLRKLCKSLDKHGGEVDKADFDRILNEDRS